MSQLLDLGGLWDFAFLGCVEDPDVGRVQFSERSPVPGAFDALPAHAGRLGMGVYRKFIHVPPGRAARLEFGAISRWGCVFVDGRRVAENASAYAPLEVDLPVSEGATREVRVLVDNRFHFERSPLNLEYFDWYQYGGIIRKVGLRVQPREGVWLDAIQVTPDALEYREGKVGLRILVGGEVARAKAVRWEFDGGGSAQEVGVDAAEMVVSARVPRPALWSPETPHLHEIHAVLLGRDGRKIDERRIRFGLRRMEARAGKLWLNGEPLQIRGYNRHEWHPNAGPSTPWLQQVADLQILKDAGCNFLRGHYPFDAGFLDLCDEMGFLLWEELNGGLPRPNYATEQFFLDHDAALRATVRASYNHPSVVIRGFLNEAASHEEFSRPVYERIARAYRELDPSRLVSYASNQALKDRNFDLVDLISLNVYPGWYPGWGDHGQEDVDPLELVVPCLRTCFDHYSAPEWAEKPLIISEIGAGALYGWRDPHHGHYTEEFQAALLERACREILDHPRSSGVFVWQFSDTRTWRGSRSLGRPRTFNNKGTHDEYRRPKMAAGVVREIFRAAAKTTDARPNP